ncbi:hypothetical protein QMTAC487_14440 [Sphaerotilus sp. FB-3]|nr:hypothetical protein QMTAC487_14440 [Sphaerotilus sp. FB-3]
MLAAAVRLARWRMGACVSYRPEADESPAEVVARLIGSMARLSELPAEAALLVQPAALGQDAVQMMRLLAAARSRAMPVTLDLVAPEATGRLIDQLAMLRVHHDRLGLSLSADRESSLHDADRACEAGVRLRLVHERWADTGAARRQSTEAFERLVDRVAGRATQVMLACHDPQTLDRSVEQLRRAGSAVTLELQPDQPRQGVLWVARSRQVPVRSLLHYGRPAAPTRLGTLARQPRVLWWSTLSSSLSTLLPA